MKKGSLDLPNISLNEEEVISDLKKEILEINNFILLQNHLLDIALKRTGDFPEGFNARQFEPRVKDVSFGKLKKYVFDHNEWLATIIDEGFQVFKLDKLYSDQLADIIKAKYLVCGFGLCKFSHQVRTPEELELKYDFHTFVLINGYEKYKRSGNVYAGQSRDKIKFYTRHGLDFITDNEHQINNKYLQMSSSFNKNGKWLFKEFYIFLPDGKLSDKFINEVKPNLDLRLEIVTNKNALKKSGDYFSCEKIPVIKVKQQFKKETQQPPVIDIPPMPPPPPPVINF